MHEEFDIRSGSMLIGDPTMELAKFDLNLPPGRYRLKEGALMAINAGDALDPKKIDLDGPYLFVLDASAESQFDSWYHEAGRATSYNIIEVVKRLPELEVRLDITVAFYWVADLFDDAVEGTFTLNPKAIERCA